MSMKVEDNLFKFYRDKRVLVTGHTGFIGSWLTRWLILLNSKVCGYALEPPSKPSLFEISDISKSITDIRGDMRDRILLRKTVIDFEPQIVFHLAAQPIVLDSYNDPVETFDTNVTGTVNLLNELRNADCVKSIVVMTSDKSYRNNEWVYPYRENDTLGGKDPYSASKSCQDIVVDSFRESYFLKSGIGISSVRSGNVIGGGDWSSHRIVPDLVRGVVNDETVKIRNPNSVRPWQHVLEPIYGMLMLGERMYINLKFSGPWNFGPEHSLEISVEQLVRKFIDLWGSGKYLIEETKNYNEANYLQLDISKSKRELKWAPQYDFNLALQETVSWYKEYYKNHESAIKKMDEQIEEYTQHSILSISK